jgi:hypothetical protein
MIVDLSALPGHRQMRIRMALGALAFLRHDDVRQPERLAEVESTLRGSGIDPELVGEGFRCQWRTGGAA